MTSIHPLVSICCFTFNHESFIREAISGFLMQNTTFSIEIIIHDDASTDNTIKIISEYQEKHPHLIKTIVQTENQYSLGHFGFVSDTFDKAQGKYIALCEGDDYWTDPLKLQKQVDFLEANSDFAICFHKVKIWEEDQLKEDFVTRRVPTISTIVDLAKGNYIHTPSCVFRNNTSKILGANFSRCLLGDYYLHMMNAQYGNIFCIDEVMAVYRVHKNSVWSSKSLIERMQKTLDAMIYILADLSDTSCQVRQEFRSSFVNLAIRLYDAVNRQNKLSRHSQPLVTICIPTFNGEEFIAEALCSALSQTYPYIQILVSDDSSTDKTLEIAKSFQKNNNSVEFLIFHHERYGLAGNWNFCISQAKGKYIKFLMQDDLLEPDCIEEMVSLAEQDDEVGLVFSPRDIIMSKSAESDPASQFVYEGCKDLHKAWTKLKPIQSSQELLADPKFLDAPPLNKIGEPSTVLIRKDVFERLSNFDPQLQQLIDLDMWFRIIGNYKIGFVNKTLSYFRIHPRQASRTNFTNGESSKDTQRFYTKMLSSSEYSFLSAAHKHLISNTLAHIHNWQLQSQQLKEENLCSVIYPVIDPVKQKTHRPKWSVMIPTYNPNLEYLEKTLRSVLEQDLGCEEMQIEVVDDRSTQNDPEELVRKIGQGISFYRQPKNLGLIGNWNACISRAHGHLVHILHQDDVVKPGFYRRLEAAFLQEPSIGAAFCRYFYMDEKGCERDLSLLERETPGVIPNWIERIAVTQRIECPSIVVKREVYEKLGGFCQEAHYAADWEMWKRIAAYYSVWYEPELLASYRSHSSSESSRLIKSGANIADTLKAIEISQSYLPATISTELSNQARENCAFKALNIARHLLSKGDVDAAIAQLREGIKSSQSSNTIVSMLELVQEMVRDSYQYNLLPIDALNLFLSAFQEASQKQEAIALIENLKLRETNFIIFPDWSQPEDLLYQDLASAMTSLMNHPDINQTTLLLDRGNLSEEEATLFVSGVVMNLVMEENLDVADELEISLVGQLNEMQWEVLSSRINARIVLEHENQQAIAQSKIEKIPTYEIASFSELTTVLT